MTITRDVVIDLLPVYEAGEASADTRALVDEFLKQDTEFARIVKAARTPPVMRTAAPPPPAAADAEITAVTRTRAALRWQNWTFGVALLLTLLPFSIVFTDTIRFSMWRDVPAARFLLVPAAGLWWVYFRQSRPFRKAGW